MAETTFYICDRCGKSQENNSKDMHHVSIMIRSIPPPHYGTVHDGSHKKLWCRECLARTGIVDWEEPGVTPPTTPPTLEDMIIEIVQDAMGDAG